MPWLTVLECELNCGHLIRKSGMAVKAKSCQIEEEAKEKKIRMQNFPLTYANNERSNWHNFKTFSDFGFVLFFTFLFLVSIPCKWIYFICIEMLLTDKL